jgi:hypothetical protein
MRNSNSPLDSTPTAETEQEQQRLLVLSESGLLQAERVPIFDEATESVARFLEIPICIVGLMDRDWQWLKATVGWSELEQRNPLATARQIKRSEAFCTAVVERKQPLHIRDTSLHPNFSHRLFVQQYGIRAYLGGPLLTAEGHCLGTLAVMDLAPRVFRPQEIQFIEMTARWLMSELQRQQAVGGNFSEVDRHFLPSPLPVQSFDDEMEAQRPRRLLERDYFAEERLKTELLDYLMQDLRTPLTSVMGMTGILTREIYGPLRDKQKEYLQIIQNSGQYLLALVDEILSLRDLDSNDPTLHLNPVDIEMLCQQVVNALEPVADRRDRQIEMSVEPGDRIWILDKEKSRQMLYHLMFRVIHTADAECTARLHICRKSEGLNISAWVSHPWLHDSLPDSELYACQIFESENAESDVCSDVPAEEAFNPDANQFVVRDVLEYAEKYPSYQTGDRLGILLSARLAKQHGGRLSIQGSVSTGFRYVLNLPEMSHDAKNGR